MWPRTCRSGRAPGRCPPGDLDIQVVDRHRRLDSEVEVEVGVGLQLSIDAGGVSLEQSRLDPAHRVRDMSDVSGLEGLDQSLDESGQRLFRRVITGFGRAGISCLPAQFLCGVLGRSECGTDEPATVAPHRHQERRLLAVTDHHRLGAGVDVVGCSGLVGDLGSGDRDLDLDGTDRRRINVGDEVGQRLDCSGVDFQDDGGAVDRDLRQIGFHRLGRQTQIRYLHRDAFELIDG